ncbi:MAG: RHS repeat domain-containing protein [Dysgonomonas sp.]|uniref:RHS repeat domain-containing protein n=1 Tax=Dysgonomonas sp. TaxID=1891233 RepID=UPI003A8AF1EA
MVQSTQYYPFGMPFADATGAGVQPYKYNNKELDGRNGLNMYDNLARLYDPGIPLTLTPDPHAENYYSWSPYVWVANNPMKHIDPTGMDWYRDDKGNVMWQKGDDETVTKTYEGENGSFTTTYTNIGSTYSQRIDDYTFLHYDQNTLTVYYSPEDFQNGDLARNAQISQSPYTQGGPDAMGWSCSMDGYFAAWFEGNVVINPENEIVDILRVNQHQVEEEKIAIFDAFHLDHLKHMCTK